MKKMLDKYVKAWYNIITKRRENKKMSEIKEYILTEEEQKACINLIKEMRKEKEKVFTFNFKGSIKIKAENLEKADDFFWDWVGDVEDMSYCRCDESRIITDFPIFEEDSIEKE